MRGVHNVQTPFPNILQDLVLKQWLANCGARPWVEDVLGNLHSKTEFIMTLKIS
jgi:hypothetical protein